MFLDASAIVAILVREAEAGEFTNKLESARQILISPLARFEAVLAVARIQVAPSLEAVGAEIDRFLVTYSATNVDITSEIGSEALIAHCRFGKGRHPAGLNMGDCFAYACAKVHNVPLLCKGGDFSQTDITIA